MWGKHGRLGRLCLGFRVESGEGAHVAQRLHIAVDVATADDARGGGETSHALLQLASMINRRTGIPHCTQLAAAHGAGQAAASVRGGADILKCVKNTM